MLEGPCRIPVHSDGGVIFGDFFSLGDENFATPLLIVARRNWVRLAFGFGRFSAGKILLMICVKNARARTHAINANSNGRQCAYACLAKPRGTVVLRLEEAWSRKLKADNRMREVPVDNSVFLWVPTNLILGTLSFVCLRPLCWGRLAIPAASIADGNQPYVVDGRQESSTVEDIM